MLELRANDKSHNDFVKGQEVDVIDYNGLRKKQRAKAIPLHGKIIFVSDRIVTVNHGNYNNSYLWKDIERKEVLMTKSTGHIFN